MIRYGLLLAIVFLSFIQVHSQVITTRPGADTMKVVNLIHADRISSVHIDTSTDIQTLAGSVHMTQDNTVFYCDSAVFNRKTRFIESFGNVHIIDNDTVHIKSQYLQYYVDTKMAYLKNKVSLTDTKSTLYTDDLQYDLNTKIGEYHNGGKLINKTSVLNSKEGTYYEELKDVYFKGKVDLKDPKYTLKTDSLLYNTTTQVATFIAPTTIVDSAKRTIKTSDGFYDTHNSKAYFGKRPTLTDGAVRVTAETIESDDASGVSKLRGNAVYVDTAQGVAVLANSIDVNRAEGNFLATQHPLMIIKQDGDSIYIAADTLYSGRHNKLTAEFKPLLNVPEPAREPSKQKSVADGNLVKRAGVPMPAGNRKPGGPPPSDEPGKLPAPAPGTNDPATGNKPDSAIGKATTAPADQPALVLNPPAMKTVDTFAKKAIDTPVTTVNALVVTNKNTKGAKQKADTTTKKPVKVMAVDNKNDSTDRYFQAWHHVRIFSDSMQAMSDSLFYSGKDSTFRLFTNPVLWASKSQITGDTIYLYTKNKKPERMYVFENGFAVNVSDTNMYNQIKGNRLNGYFKEGNIDYMRAQGNGESIYYIKDERNYLVGINNATADIIDIRFKNKEMNKVVYISDVNGTMYPYRQAKEENKILRNFHWLEDKRPKTKFELFEQ